MPARHTPRHRPPRLWLFTDERAEASLFDALACLPRGAGIVFRHHATPAPARRGLFERVRRVARAKRLLLVLAGPVRLARAWRADGVHGREKGRRAHRRLLVTSAAHDRRELIAARRRGADLIFVSPVFATRSHPGARTLGPVRLGLMLRGPESRATIVALGGVDRNRFRRLAPLGIHGWAAIDAWAEADQKR